MQWSRLAHHVISLRRKFGCYWGKADIGKVTALHFPCALPLHLFYLTRWVARAKRNKLLRLSPFVAPEILEARWRKFDITHGVLAAFKMRDRKTCPFGKFHPAITMAK